MYNSSRKREQKNLILLFSKLMLEAINSNSKLHQNAIAFQIKMPLSPLTRFSQQSQHYHSHTHTHTMVLASVAIH